MKALVPMLAAAAMAGALALPVAAQTLDDYGAMTCVRWNDLESADKPRAAQGLQAFVEEAANHDVAGAATGLLEGKTEHAVQMIDNACDTADPDATAIAALIAN